MNTRLDDLAAEHGLGVGATSQFFVGRRKDLGIGQKRVGLDRRRVMSL